MKHTGSWGAGECTFGEVTMNGHAIASDYGPPDHMINADIFSVPEVYLQSGENVLSFHLADGDFIWWIRDIEASW